MLSDPKKKQMYDQLGHDAFERGGMPGAAPGGSYGGYQQGPFSYTYTTNMGDFGDFSDPFEIFEQFFGFRSPFGGQRAARRPVYQLQLIFNEAVKGVEKKVKIGHENKTVKVPAGVDEGMRIRFTDFDLVVSVLPDRTFRREGQDIYVEKKIAFPLAVLGGEVEVPTLDGTVKLRVRPGTKSETVVRLRGQGVVYPNSTQKGDEYVIFKIDVPEKVSSKVKKILEELKSEI